MNRPRRFSQTQGHMHPLNGLGRAPVSVSRNISKMIDPRKLIKNVGDQTTRSSVYKLSQAHKELLVAKTQREMPTIDIYLRIISTWSDQELVSCSQITPLNENKMPIRIISYAVLNEDAAEGSEYLFDNNLIKDLKETWKAKFNPNHPLDIKMTIPSDETFAFIRIYNDKPVENMGIKNIEIWFKNQKICEGMVDQGFSTVIEVKEQQAQTCRFPAFSGLADVLETPRTRFKSITIQFLSNYGDNRHFSLSGIEFFDHKKEKIPYENFKTMQFLNCSTNIDQFNRSIKYPFNREVIRSTLMLTSNGILKPAIRFSFVSKQVIGIIRVWNAHSQDTNPEDGVRNIKILNGKDTIFVGKLHQSFGKNDHLTKSLTLLYFCDLAQ